METWNDLLTTTGYGQSSKPRGSDTHIEYSKREMANDLTQVMSHLGHSRFSIIGHDRGARVAYRLALDYPEKVDKMILLDIAPTLWMYEHTDMAFVGGPVLSTVSCCVPPWKS